MVAAPLRFARTPHRVRAAGSAAPARSGLLSERPPFVLPNESPEPFAQASRLSRDIVEFSGHGLCPQRLECFGRHELRLLQPGQQTVAVVDPVDFRVDRRRNRIEEIQAKRVGDEYRGRAF